MQFTKIIWRDGQPHSSLFDDIYYSSDENEAVSGESEFKHVFFKNNGLPERWHSRDDFVIAELGFGSGLNCVLTIREWLSHCEASNSRKTLHYIAIEKHPLSPDTIIELMSPYPELKRYTEELVKDYPPAVEATHRRSLFDNRVVIHYRFMDVLDALDDEGLNVDAWYLDGFSPAKNPAMWSEELFSKLTSNSHDGATCSTYTAAGFVKRNLQKAGFITEKVPGFGKKRDMLVARLPIAGEESKAASPLRYDDKPWFQRPAPFDISKNRTATIIGAGIAGLSLAYSLVQRGWSVTVIDKHAGVAKGASSNPAPIIYPRLSANNDIDMKFYTSAYCHVLYVLEKLQAASDRQFWFAGGLLQHFDKTRFDKIVERYKFNEDYISKLDGTSQGEVIIDYVSAGVVLPAILCELLVETCADKLELIEADIDEIRFHDDSWHCFSRSRPIQDDDVLIVANGTQINGLGLRQKFPVEVVRGQVAVLNANQASSQIKKTRNADVHITPAIDGKHYLGATYDRDSKMTTASQEDNRALIESLNTIYPDMFTEDDCSGAWVGFRTISKDRMPIVGAAPDVDFYEAEYADIRHGSKTRVYDGAAYLKGLYISAAHGSRGFTSSFLCAEIIASLIDGSVMPVAKEVLDSLSPSRFIVNDLKRR
jgi:tRNA 5-methylaminomethyl-2-thiouridine biosynthesis bifunctional protein